MKKCCRCNEVKELSEFGKDRNAGDGLTYACKKCRNERYKLYYHKNPDEQREKNRRREALRKEYYRTEKGIESSRRTHLKRKYNMTLEEYNTMSEAQDHKCQICGKPEMNNKNKVLCVDHNHETGAIRGLLCGLCNTGLGNFLDNKQLITKAIKYLEKYGQ